MAIPVPRHLVEFALLGSMHDRRQLQDSPILGDVWLQFATAPDQSRELLIEPHWEESAGTVAIALNDAITRTAKHGDADIAPLHGVVAACLYFDEVVNVVVPRTTWWNKRMTSDRFKTLSADGGKGDALDQAVDAVMQLKEKWFTTTPAKHDDGTLPALDRFLALVAAIQWASEQKAAGEAAIKKKIATITAKTVRARIMKLLESLPAPKLSKTGGHRPDIIWLVSLNRTATPALVASVPAVKADAARRLFGVECSKIAWAVIDSGIRGDHPAFTDNKGNSRVKRGFDFTNIRKIVSLDNIKPERRKQRLAQLLHDDLLDKPTEKEATKLLEALAKDSEERRPIHWELVRPFVEIKPATRPAASDHGTHVAGVIGANKDDALREDGVDPADVSSGLCPDIQLYDFRVLAPGLKETEFAIIAALQFIRYINDRTDYMSIHGANLSLSIPHDVRNYACGRTPICLECERLVDSGVMVVAAAGNFGYQSFQTTEGAYDSYAAFSITDPGNADGVLTVGSTHRSAPHTYGVSFFSSRGPTGDGRAKPDLVAPGERIRAPFREGWGDLDGTSMAAPHASGAAAMLMARYTELIAQPRRVKRILCESATDLGREKSFQGAGMLDVLRALQSI